MAASLFGGQPAQASDQTRVLVTTNYYTVTGRSMPELWASMVQAGPWKTNFQYHARTDSEVHYRYTTRVRRYEWSIGSVSVVTKVTVFLPRWIPPPGTDPVLIDAWAHLQKGLRLHELGHESVARAATTELRRQLSALPAQDSPEALQAAANSAAKRTLETYRKMDADYDQKTHHGITQGAVLRLPPPRHGPPYWAMRPN